MRQMKTLHKRCFQPIQFKGALTFADREAYSRVKFEEMMSIFKRKPHFPFTHNGSNIWVFVIISGT